MGANAYATGKAKTISGITTNDSTGKIMIHLIAPYGAFDNVLAFPSLAPVPPGTPIKNEPTSPPPGVGPYKITNIVPNASYLGRQEPALGADEHPGDPGRPRERQRQDLVERRPPTRCRC